MQTTLPSSFNILCFNVSQVRFCAELQYVNKVIALTKLEPMPGSPSYFAGLLNVNGSSVPVFDLALCLGLKRKEKYTLETPILLCSDGFKQAGIIVDEILNVLQINKNELQMQEQFKKGPLPFTAVVPIQSDLFLLINVHRMLEISLTTHAQFNFDEKLKNMVTQNE